MSNLSARIIRMAVDTDRKVAPLDALAGGQPVFWAGSPTSLRLGFFLGGALVTDFTGVSGIEVQLKTLGNGGGAPPEADAPLASVITTELLTGVTDETWKDGSGWHAEIDFSSANLARAAAKYWLVVVALPASGEPFTLAAGTCEITGDGYGSGEASPDPESPPYTQAESDAKYLGKTGAFVSGNLVKTDGSGAAVDAGVAVSTDGTLASNSDAKLATEKAVKTYADGKMAKVATATGDVMINAAGSAVSSGLKIAPANSAAGDLEVMLGDDIRAGFLGGLRKTGGGAHVIALSLGERDFSATFVLRRAAGGAPEIALFDAANGLLFYFFSATGVLRLALRPAVTVLIESPANTLVVGEKAYFTVTKGAGVLSLYKGETLVGSCADTNDYGSNPVSMFADYANTSSFVGDIYRIRWANFAYSADERAGAARGESRGRLATLATGVSYTTGDSSTFTGGVGFWSGYAGGAVAAVSGKLRTTTSSGVPDWGNQFYDGTPATLLGVGSYRATFKAKLVSGNIPVLAVTSPYDATSVGNATTAALTGTEAPYVVYFDVKVPGTLIGINPPYLSGASVSSVFELDDVVIEALGTRESFEPGGCTRRRWIGVNGQVIVLDAWALALNPTPVEVKAEKIRYNLATSTASDPVPVGWTLTPISTGIVKITPPAWARAIDRPLITAVTDGNSFVAVDYDTDAIDIYLTCKTVGTTPAVTAAKLRIALDWRE